MVAADGEYAEAAQQIEVAPSGRVVEVRALAAREVHVVAEGFQHPHQLRVEMLLVEGIFLALPFGQDAREIEGHAAPFTTAVEATLPAPAQGPTAALMPRPPPRCKVRFPGGQASFPRGSVQPAAVEDRAVRPEIGR